jgi:hypothetical protein
MLRAPLRNRGSQTRRWSKVDSNPLSLVSRIYAQTDIAVDREHRGRLDSEAQGRGAQIS